MQLSTKIKFIFFRLDHITLGLIFVGSVFTIEMIFAFFQDCGIMLLFITILYIEARYFIAIGPRCLRCLMLILSGPVELLFFVRFMNSITRALKMLTSVVTIDFISLFFYWFFGMYSGVFGNCIKILGFIHVRIILFSYLMDMLN